MSVTLNLSEEEAKALYAYTKTSLEGDDNYDNMRELLVETTEKLKEQL